MAKTILRRKRILAWAAALILTLLQATIWQAVTPAWTAPDEPGHYLYARLMAESGRIPTQEDLTPLHQRLILDSLQQSGWQQYIHPQLAEGPQPDIAQDPILAASGHQIGRKPPGYYALAAAWLRLHPQWERLSPSAQLYWIRQLSLLLRLLTTLAALFLATRLWPDSPERILGLGLLVGLMPMVGFIGGSLNNDALSLLWGAAAFTALVLARSPAGWLLALALILSGPLLADTSLLYLWPLALLRLTFFRKADGGLQFAPSSLSRALLLGGGILLLLLVILLAPNPRYAAGWRWRNADRTRNNGQLSLRADEAPASLFQILSGKEILQRRGRPLTLQARVTGQGGALILEMSDDIDRVDASCSLTPDQQLCRLHFTPSSESEHLYVVARLPKGEAQFQLDLTDVAGWSLLTNGHGALPAPLGAPIFTWLERHLPISAGYFSRVLSPSVWDAPSLLRYSLYALFTWASFWGYFGWLSRPFPWYTYAILAVVTLAALLGLIRKFERKSRSSDTDAGILIFSLFALLLILLQTWLPMLGSGWQPQGRYLFPALLPIALLLLLGWEALLPETRRYWLPAILLIALTLLNIQAWVIVAS